MNGKKWWFSKTLWVNLIAICALIVQSYTGFVIDPEKQVVILGIVNTILRVLTKEPIVWSKDGGPTSSIPLMAFAVITLAIFLGGCASTKQSSPTGLATKSLLTMKETIVATAVIGDDLCAKRVLKQENCDLLAYYYGQAQPAYDVAADALISAIRLDNSKEAWERYRIAQERFVLLFGGVMTLAADYGMIPQLEGGAQ